MPREHLTTGPRAEGRAAADPLAALWAWLSSWEARDGGVNGPVVHRGDLKRMFAVHDTPWTQHAVIAGLLHLYRRSGHDYWLSRAVRLGDAQCARQAADGRFRRAGHEDDRFSSLIHNALADCALLDLAAALRERGDDAIRSRRYVAVAERNLRTYLIARLYRPALGGFAVNPTDYYADRDRFVVNMNSAAVEALAKLDRQQSSDRHAALLRTVGERIASLQSDDGGLPYSDLEPAAHIPLYVGIALRGLPALSEASGNPAWGDVARRAVAFLKMMQDGETGLWHHKLEDGRRLRFPIFVAGAGMICNGILDAAKLTGDAVDADDLAARLLQFQYPHGPIRNFIGYDHPDNGRSRGNGVDCWEDVFPTPNWSAQAFHFLCRVLPPPEPSATYPRGRWCARSRRYVYVDTARVSAVAGTRPPATGIAAVYVKRRRYGLVLLGPRTTVRAALRTLLRVRALRLALETVRARE